jgi:hypothetical protein
MTDTPETPPEYVPFNMDCQRCEYERSCFLPLKVINKVTRHWGTFCKQGRKRKVVRQSTIQEALDRFERRKVGAEEE